MQLTFDAQHCWIQQEIPALVPHSARRSKRSARPALIPLQLPLPRYPPSEVHIIELIPRRSRLLHLGYRGEGFVIRSGKFGSMEVEYVDGAGGKCQASEVG